MSANNWRPCPRCRLRALAEAAEKLEQASASYGQIPMNKFLECIRQAQLRQEEPLDATLREDYELGTSEIGRFFVSYSCNCSTCGWTHHFEHECDVEVTV
jgi:hypothetical protein